MFAKLAKIAGALALLSLLAAGCGAESSTSTAVTKAGFIKQADAICKKTDEEKLAAYEETIEGSKKKFSKAEQNEIILNVALPPVRAEIEELAALDAPEEDRQQIEAMIAKMEKALAMVEEEPRSITGEEAADPNPFIPVNELTAAYGFKVCSELL